MVAVGLVIIGPKKRKKMEFMHTYTVETIACTSLFVKFRTCQGSSHNETRVPVRHLQGIELIFIEQLATGLR